MGILPKSKWITAFAVVSIIQAATVLALESYVFVRFNTDVTEQITTGSNSPATTIPVFLALYIFAFVYQLVLVWDAIRMKNTIQIIGLVGLNVGLLIYGAVQIDQFHDSADSLKRLGEIPDGTWRTCKPLLIVIPCVLAITTIVLGFLAYKLYNEFAWTIYKHISADLRMKRRYLTYQVYVALLKFNAFFCLGFTIQFVIIVKGGDIERILTACSIPITIIIMLAAFFFVRREIMVGTVAVIVLYFGGLAYFVFKFLRMYLPGPKRSAYDAVRKELTTFAVLTILLTGATIVYACLCAVNYGKGLKPYIMHSNTKAVVGPDDRPQFDEIHGSANSYNPAASYQMQSDGYPQKPSQGRANARMEID